MTKKWHALPEFLEIRDSPIHGKGLFTKEDLGTGYLIGLGWVITSDMVKVRTPIGGFINHSRYSNVMFTSHPTEIPEYRYVITTRDVNAGEEILITYEDWSPDDTQTDGEGS